jgi:hypothetical protein
MQRLRRLHAAHQLEARQFDFFHPRAREPHWLRSPKEARETVVNLMARNSPGARVTFSIENAISAIFVIASPFAWTAGFTSRY